MDLYSIALRLASTPNEAGSIPSHDDSVGDFHGSIQSPLRSAAGMAGKILNLLDTNFSSDQEQQVRKIMADFVQIHGGDIQDISKGLNILYRQVGDAIVSSRR